MHGPIFRPLILASSSVPKAYAFVAVVIGFLAASFGAQAQTASQITPRSFRPEASAPGVAIEIAERPSAKPPGGDDTLSVKLSSVRVEGEFPELRLMTSAWSAEISARRVTAAEIFAFARKLEAAYADAGFALVRIVLPAQRLVDGASLRLVLFDGALERIDTSQVDASIRARVENVLAPLVGQRRLRLKEIERRLLLASDTPGARLRSTIAAGSSPGASILLIEGRHRLVTGALTFDNSLSRALGRANAGAALEINSALGMGDLFYLRLGGRPQGGGDGFFTSRAMNSSVAAGFVLPLGADGLSLNLEGANTRATPRAEGLRSSSEFERLSVRLHYPWLKSRRFSFSSDIVFDAASERSTVVGSQNLPLSLDRLRILRAAGDLVWSTPSDGLLTARVTASVGLDALGARPAREATADLPLSREGADASFGKLDANVTFGQPLTDHLAIELRARAQSSFAQALLRSEQIGLSGSTSVSTLDAGGIQGDSGLVLRAELQSPWTVPVSYGHWSAAPYAFLAAGRVWLERPTAVEPGRIDAHAFGLGLRLAGAPGGALSQNLFSQASVSIEWGREYRSDGGWSSRTMLMSALHF